MLDIALGALALTPTTFNVGGTVRVTVSFKYTVGVNTSIKLRAGPYYTNILGKHMVDSCVGQADVSLIAALTPTDETATVDFTLLAKANGGIDDGTYGLRVWIDGTQAVAEQDSVIIVTGNPTTVDIMSMLMPLMVVMMMGMIMPMMEEAA